MNYTKAILIIALVLGGFPLGSFAQSCGNLVINPITGLLDCTGSSGGGSGTVQSVNGSNGVASSTGSAFTVSGTLWADWPRNAQTGTTYPIVTGDRGKVVTFSNGSSIAVSINGAGTTGFEAGWLTVIKNIGAGTVTITPGGGSLVDGAATITLVTGDWALLSSNGTDYETVNNKIISGSGVNVVAARTGKQAAADTAVMESRLNAQAGASNYSITAGSSTVYTAALTPTATVAAPSLYSDGGVIRVKWDETCGANPTINVDSLGARKIYKRNGTSASTQLGAGECIANQINVLTYNSSLDSGTGGFETDIGGGGSAGVPATGADGIVVCTGTNCSTSTTRTITASGGIAITNGDGVSAAPAIASTVYNDGYYDLWNFFPTPTSGSTPVANRVYVSMFRAKESYTFTRLAGMSTSVASKAFACGIYDASKNVIVQGRLDNGTAWYGNVITVASTTLTKGTIYWLACAFEDTGMSSVRASGANIFYVDPTPFRFGYVAETVTGSNTTYTLPSSFTTVSHATDDTDGPVWVRLYP